MIDTSSHIESRWLPWFIVAIFALLGTVCLAVIISVGLSLAYVKSFTQTAGIDVPFVYSEIRQGLDSTPLQSNGVKNVLILGTDAVANRDDSFVLTDTMMLVSLDLKSGTVRTLSLPRDLWSEEYQTKINALYFYGNDIYPNNPEVFPTEVIQSMTGIPIHHTMIVSLDSLGTLIDSVEGIPIVVEHGFTDTQFPRTDVDITSGDPDELYETVTFVPGEEQMNSTRALQYIRSRKSGDDEGTDVARGKRQQQVIEALAKELVSVSTFSDPERLGKVYMWYKQNYQEVFPLHELVATAQVLAAHVQSLSFVQHTLSIFPDDPNGVIEHPDTRLTQNIWVYAIRDYEAFQQEVQSKLGIL